MESISASKARANIYKLIDVVAESHTQMKISGKRGNAVLVGEEDWNAIQETLHLVSIPGMRKSILDGMKLPVDKCTTELKW
ncbi:MAG: type II toxin-antitoxin system Phd/YefM family antitoxin [Candidatus Obscuribacterales bacterium]|nr:type II toxin-antitoxin system Phd/YefM family antitoxin [Candidatus Obscuribacterales bacterium]